MTKLRISAFPKIVHSQVWGRVCGVGLGLGLGLGLGILWFRDRVRRFVV